METGGGAPGSLAAGGGGGWSNDFGFRVGRHAVAGTESLMQKYRLLVLNGTKFCIQKQVHMSLAAAAPVNKVVHQGHHYAPAENIAESYRQ